MLLGPEEMKRITQEVLSASDAEHVEVVVSAAETHLTRFANSRIHQNVSEQNVQIRVRAVTGRRVGVATVNDASSGALAKVAATALRIARLQPENPDFRSLPAPRPIANINAFVSRTADCSPELRGRSVSTVCQLAKEDDLVASGAFTTAASELCVANSLGVLAYAPSTFADLATVIMSEDSSGYASATSPDVGQIDPEELARQAIGKALRSRNPTALEPGAYAVILEEDAVAEMLSYLAYLGLGALAVQEGRSFMAGKLGQRITGSNISLWDDGLDPTGLPITFDFEGTPKQRVDLIVDGVANAVVYDSYTAGRENRASTGHALPAPNAFGPFPGNLFMKPGTYQKGKMLQGIDRGLWVTRFHYVNPVHPLKAVLTGMTRDGTFLIEHGEVTRPVQNLRFTQGVLEALSRVEAIGSRTKLCGSYFGGSRVPALRIGEFTFTSATRS